MSIVHSFYRLAPRAAAQPKAKLAFATKLACLRNFIGTFGPEHTTVFGDRLDENLLGEVRAMGLKLIEVNEGSGGGNFRAAAKAAMALPSLSWVYLVEDDFLHRPEAAAIVGDGLKLGFEYVTVYDHPDKYLHRRHGGNPHVHQGGERTRVLCGEQCHWKITNSTVMTFATTAGQLRKDWKNIVRWCGGRFTDDYRLFRSLGLRGRRLGSAIPGYATHCETQWLTPFFDWASIAEQHAPPPGMYP